MVSALVTALTPYMVGAILTGSRASFIRCGLVAPPQCPVAKAGRGSSLTHQACCRDR